MTTFYVDPAGSDAADGQSSGTAVATLAKATTLMAGGDRLLLKRGSYWREQLTVPASGTAQAPTVVGAYGAGDRPVVKGSAVLTNAAFALKSADPGTPSVLYVEDTFVRADQAGWGTTSGGTDSSGSRAWTVDATNLSILTNRGKMAKAFGGEFAYVGAAHAGSVEVETHFEGVPTTSDNFGDGPRLRHGASSGYEASYQRSNGTLYIRDEYHGTTLASVAVASIGTDFNVIFRAEDQADGSVQLRACVFNKGASQPAWQLDINDNVLKFTTGQVGVRMYNTVAAGTSYMTYFAARTLAVAGASYAKTYTLALATDPKTIVCENGAVLTQQGSIAAVEANAGSFYWAGGTLYLHPTGDTNPTTDGKLYEAAARTNCVRALTKDYVQLLDLQGEHALETGLLVDQSTGSKILRCIGRRCAWQGIGNTTQRVQDSGCEVGNCDAYENKQYAGITHENGLLRDCRSWSNGVDNFRDHGIYVSYSKGGQVRVRNCKSWGNAAYGIKHGQFATDGRYERNLCYGNGRGAAVADGGGSGSKWRNNTFVGGLWGFTLYSANGAVTVDEFRNNIVQGASQYGVYKQGTNTGTITSFTNNDVQGNSTNWRSDGGAAVLNGGAWADPAGSNGNLSGDPLFANSAGNDYTLQAASPARNAGVDILHDHAGPGPDIGALEIGAPGSW